MVTFDIKESTCYLNGTLVISEIPSLWEQKEELFSPNVTKLNLANLKFIDSAGLAFLVQLVNFYKNQKRSILLENPAEQLCKLIKLYNLQAYFQGV